jgi:hypothetical protein
MAGLSGFPPQPMSRCSPPTCRFLRSSLIVVEQPCRDRACRQHALPAIEQSLAHVLRLLASIGGDTATVGVGLVHRDGLTGFVGQRICTLCLPYSM